MFSALSSPLIPREALQSANTSATPALMLSEPWEALTSFCSSSPIICALSGGSTCDSSATSFSTWDGSSNRP